MSEFLIPEEEEPKKIVKKARKKPTITRSSADAALIKDLWKDIFESNLARYRRAKARGMLKVLQLLDAEIQKL